MSTSMNGRITRLEDRLTSRTCGTCHGGAFAIVYVPDGADENAPEYCPSQCRECGIPLRHVQRIIGMTEDEVA